MSGTHFLVQPSTSELSRPLTFNQLIYFSVRLQVDQRAG